jgi:arylformamidase
MKYVDLSVAINEDTPIYPGDPKTSIKPAGVLDKDGYCDHYLSIGTHVGTHVDAPMHMIAGGKSLDQIPVDQFIGRGVYVDVTDGNFDSVKSADIQEGDIVLLHTGMSTKYHKPVYFDDYPAMSDEIANYLVQKKIKMIGVDTCSVDNKDGFPVHKILLGGDVLIIENLTNLEQLMGKRFRLFALPINLQIDGAPARVIAEIEK